MTPTGLGRAHWPGLPVGLARQFGGTRHRGQLPSRDDWTNPLGRRQRMTVMTPHAHTRSVPAKRRGPRTRLGVGVAVALTVAVAGCSGGEEQAPPAATQTAPSSASESSETSGAPATDAPTTEDPAADNDSVTTQAPSGEAAPSPADDEGAAEVIIVISDFAYDVPDTVAPGSQITIRNEDGVGHTVTSDEEGLFDVLVGPGQEETLTVPDQPGEYSFFCKPHPNMVDTLVIG